MPFRTCGLAGMFSACIIYVILSTAGSKNEAERVTTDKESTVKVVDDLKIHNCGQIANSGPEIKSIRPQYTNGGRKINVANGKDNKETAIYADKFVVRSANVVKNDSNIRNVGNESKSEILTKCFFSINLWLLMIVGGLTTFVLKSMSDWTGLFLVEHFSLSIAQSTELMLCNEMGGMLGTLMCGFLSDYLGGRKFLTLLIFTAICISGVIYFPTEFPFSSQVVDSTSEAYLSPLVFNDFVPEMFLKSLQNNTLVLFRSVHGTFSGRIGTARICLFLMGFGINGPKTLLGVMVRDLVPRGVSGTVGGVFGLISQIGASASGAGWI